MQGLPTNLLTQNVATAANKVESNSTEGANKLDGQVASNESKQSKNLFAEIFSNLLGNSEAKVEGQIEGNSEKSSEEMAQTTSPETKLDVLLKKKELEKNQKIERSDLSNEKVLSADVLSNVSKLINSTPIDDSKITNQLGDKISSTGSDLDQLLKSLKNTSTEVPLEGETELTSTNVKTSSPLDFLLKESNSSNIKITDTKNSKVLQTNPEMVSKLGLSSEDFISQKIESKDPRTQIIKNADENFDLKSFGQVQMNQSMKAYGQKQNILNDGVIRNTKDLAFGEAKKSKSEINELTSPDMKIGADLSLIKEPFIPMMQKSETTQNPTTPETTKVLDLSKINSSNTTEIIKKISDYIEQSQVANSNTMDLTVKHDSLGQFKIQVNKPMGPGSQRDMQITTSTPEGHDFFMKNEIGLMKNLSQAGIQLSDFRIISGGDSASFAGNDSRQNNNSQNNAEAGREFMSFDTTGDSSHGSDRRRQLWQEAKANQQRYGA